MSDTITKIQWSQKNPGKLATLVKGSNDVSIYTIKRLNETICLNYNSDEHSKRRLYVDKTERNYFKINLNFD